MTQTQEFDLHAAIRKLAKAEWACPNSYLHRAQANVENVVARAYVCTVCNGTGRIVPFASLRVSCPNFPWHDNSCLGWTPEPDVEKACWRVWKVLSDHVKEQTVYMMHGENYNSWEEAVIRAALAWLEEQHGPER